MSLLLLTSLLAATVVVAKNPQISANSWGDQRLDVFSIASDKSLWHKYHVPDPNGPFKPDNAFELQTGSSVTAPSITSWSENRLDYFVTGPDNKAYHRFWDGSNWQPALDQALEHLGSGAVLTSALSSASWGVGRLDVVGLAGDGTYVHLYYNGDSWVGWEGLGGKFFAAPSIVSWGPQRFDVFGIGPKGSILHQYFDGSQYQPGVQEWEDLGGGPFVGDIETTSWAEGRLDIFAVSADGALNHLWFPHDGGWSSWESLGGNFSTAPQVAHWSENRIDIVGQFVDDTAYQYKFWSGSDWQPSVTGWISKGGSFASQPAVVSWGLNILNILGIDTAGQLQWQLWAWGNWYPNASGYYPLGDTKTASSFADILEENQIVMQPFKTGL